MTIKNSVGKGGKNDPADMEIIRGHLVRHRQWVDADLRNTVLSEDILARAISKFQETAGALAKPDGRVDPGGFTLKRLEMTMIARPRHKVFASMCWNPGTALSDADFQTAATTLGCEKEAIQAVAIVETRRAAHDELGRPTILFERHKFRTYSKGLFNTSHPDLSGPQGGYGTFAVQYAKLRRAAILDEEAALKSTSWGAFQVMGFNHATSGYATVAAYVDAMIGSQANQLNAFVAHVGASSGMKNAIIAKNWATFARLYNGPDYTKNNYDTKMQNEYDRLVRARTS